MPIAICLHCFRKKLLSNNENIDSAFCKCRSMNNQRALLINDSELEKEIIRKTENLSVSPKHRHLPYKFSELLEKDQALQEELSKQI